jgi:cyanophycin synthetase
LAAIADAKLVVARALDARGRLVLNADNPVIVQAASSVTTPICWVSLDAENAQVRDAVARQGLAATVRDGTLALYEHGEWLPLVPVADTPITLGGSAAHLTLDALIAAALARGPGVPLDAIRSALRSFGSSAQDNPGRMMRMDVGGVACIVDYAHNAESLTALMRSTAGLVAGRRAVVLATGGDRGDDALRALANAAVDAGGADLYIVKDMPTFLRGRAVGEMPAVLRETLLARGVAATDVREAADDMDAVELALAWAQPGDLLLLPVHADQEAVLARLGVR